MTDDRLDPRVLAHLAGYTTIALVLATASWASIAAIVIVLPLTVVTGYLAVRYGVQTTLERAASLVDGDTDPQPATPDDVDDHQEVPADA